MEFTFSGMDADLLRLRNLMASKNIFSTTA